MNQTIGSARLEGRVALITGGAQGIGRAIAALFQLEAACVFVLDCDRNAANSTVADLTSQNPSHPVRYVPVDLQEVSEIKNAVQTIRKFHDRVDILVNNAGMQVDKNIETLTVADWNLVMNVNLRGAWYLAQEAARVMVRDRVKGAIVLTASTNAFQPEAGGLAYNVSKAGIVAIMQTAALELSRMGIRVNAIAPGIINTRLSAFVINHPTQSKVFLDRIPIGRFAEPEEMARPILWMCTDDASYLSGHLMTVDGAMTAGLPEPGELETPMPGSVR
jgi:NAD(P)-dependent dehydrogenase (short-subunit alcohol dehydrogenase family)